MKRILCSLVLLLAVSAKAEIISIDIPDEWRSTIEYSIPDLDVWIYTMVSEKYGNTQELIVGKEVKKSMEGNEGMPAGQDAIVQKYKNRPDYKSRKQRDDELENENEQ